MKRAIWVMVFLSMLTATAWAETGPEMIPTTMDYAFSKFFFKDMIATNRLGSYNGVCMLGEVEDGKSFKPGDDNEERQKRTSFRITVYDEQDRVRGYTTFIIISTFGEIKPFETSLIRDVWTKDVRTFKIEQLDSKE